MPDSSKRVIKPQYKQNACIALVVGSAIIGFLTFTIYSFYQEIGNLGKHGVVVEKEFLPAPEMQITIGQGGFSSRKIEGEHILKVRIDRTGELYNVWVSKKRFEEYKVGDKYLVIPSSPRR